MYTESSSQEDTPATLTQRQYWLFQFAGWSAMALLSYLSLTIWYNPGELAPAVHTVLQSLMGIVVSHPLRWVARRSWGAPIGRRVLANGSGVLVAALVWTALRMIAFTWLTGERIPPADWGGWINASVIVFGAWSFSYHAVKYNRQWFIQRQVATQAQNAALKAHAEAQQESMKRLEAEKLFRESQLRMLKYQLNPHFFLNALNSVSSLVQRGDKTGAIDMLARIGDFLRVSLDQPEEIQHTLREELLALDLYLGIEKVRFGDRLQTVFNIEPAARDAALPSLLLQPLFENSIKYAVSQRRAPTEVRLDARIRDGMLHLKVSDDGPGLGDVASALEAHESGIGLVNVRQRLQSAYGTRATFEMANRSPNGFVIRLVLPLDPPPVLQAPAGDDPDTLTASPDKPFTQK